MSTWLTDKLTGCWWIDQWVVASFNHLNPSVISVHTSTAIWAWLTTSVDWRVHASINFDASSWSDEVYQHLRPYSWWTAWLFPELTIATVSCLACQPINFTAFNRFSMLLLAWYSAGKNQDSITPLLVKLHWLSMVKRVRFKICLTVYKSLNGSLPEYISEFLKPVTDLHWRSTLSSGMHDQLLVPMITSEFGKQSFAFAGPSCWNQLPDYVRQSPSVDTFKRHLKTHLF